MVKISKRYLIFKDFQQNRSIDRSESPREIRTIITGIGIRMKKLK